MRRRHAARAPKPAPHTATALPAQPKPRGTPDPHCVFPCPRLSAPTTALSQSGPVIPRFGQSPFSVFVFDIVSNWSSSCALLSSVCKSCTTAVGPAGWAD